MEFFETVDSRRSVRSFQDKKIDSATLEKLLETVMSAPSAGNLQAYEIVVVKDEEKKAELAAASFDQSCVAEAPVVLVFCADEKQSEMKYEERGAGLYSVQDATIAAAYCQLAATALGLGSVWVGGFDPLEVSRIIRAEPYHVPVAMIPIGYPAEKPERPGRRSMKEMVRDM